MPPAELTRVVYRSILRWTKSAEGVPFTLRGRDVTEVCPHIPSSTGLALEDAKAVKSLAQSSFRRHQTLKVGSVSKIRLRRKHNNCAWKPILTCCKCCLFILLGHLRTALCGIAGRDRGF